MSELEFYRQALPLVEEYETARAAYVADRGNPDVVARWQAAKHAHGEFRQALRTLRTAPHPEGSVHPETASVGVESEY